MRYDISPIISVNTHTANQALDKANDKYHL